MMPEAMPDTIRSYAHAYTSSPLNWRLCKLRASSKAPMLAEWNSPSRTIGPDDVDAMFTGNDNGLGLVHEASGTGAFDVDSLPFARMAFAEFGIDIDSILKGFPRIEGREGRDKIIFSLPPGLTTVKLVWPAMADGEKPITVFELRANGGQDVLPPSIHPDTGLPYKWRVDPFQFDGGIPMSPEILLTLWRDWKSFERQFKAACPWAAPTEAAPRPVIRQVSTAHGNVIGKYNAAQDMAMLLESFGYKQRGKRWLAPTSSSGIAGVVILKDSGNCFSHHASDILNDGHSHDAFDVFRLLAHNGNFNEAIKQAARELGIEKKSESVPAVDFSGILKPRAKHNEPEKKPVARPETPSNLLSPPGVAGVFVRHILETAHIPQPELAVVAALTLCGLALGRKVATSTGLRTNLYMIGVARTGHGKEHARKMIKDALVAAKSTDLLGGEELASGQGLISRVASNPNVLFQIDEFGLFLQSVQNPSSASHKTEITTNFIKLFSAATSVYHGTEYANQKDRPRVDIICPCVTLHGTTTPETLFPALGSSHVASGYLNRLIICMSPEKRPERRRAKWSPTPESLVEWIHSARTMFDQNDSGNMALGINPESPIVVGDSFAAMNLFDEFQAEADRRSDEGEKTGTSELWARAMEHAAKLALICQLATDITSREISAESAAWAINFIRYWLSEMEYEVMTRVSDSDFGRLVQDVVRVIKAGEAHGRTERELSKYCRPFSGSMPSLRDSVIAIIIRDGHAEWVQTPSPRGKARVAMVSPEFLITADNADKSPTVLSPIINQASGRSKY